MKRAKGSRFRIIYKNGFWLVLDTQADKYRDKCSTLQEAAKSLRKLRRKKKSHQPLRKL